MIRRAPLPPSRTPFELMPLAQLAHIRTRVSKGEAHVLEMVKIMRSWPADLSTVADIYSLVLPPIGIRRIGPQGLIVLPDGNHRLTAARLAGVPAIYVFNLPDGASLSPAFRNGP